MIENLRKYTGLIIVVVALLFVGLVFFEGSARSVGRGGEIPVLSVNGRQYSAAEIELLASVPTSFAMDFRNSFGVAELGFALGGFGDTPDARKRALVNRLNLREAAESFGVHPSADQISAEIKKAVAFQGPDGAYDPQAYNDFVTKRLPRMGMKEQDFIDLHRDNIALRKLVEIVGGGLAADRDHTARKLISSDQQVSIQVARVNLEKFKEALKPTDEDLKTEWENTKDKYQTEQKIKVSYVIIKPTYPDLPQDEIKLPDAVTDEQKKEDEQKAAEKKAADEAKLAEDKRKVDAELADKVDAFLNQLEADDGEGFESLVQERGWEIATTELFSRSEVPEALGINTRSASSPKPIADFLFQLVKSEEPMTRYSDALPIADGAFLIARLDELEEPRTKTFEEALDAVRSDYIEVKAGEELKKDADEKTAKIREALAGGKSFEDAAKELELEVTSHGPFKARDPLPGESDPATLFQTAARVAPGTLADPVMRPDGALFVFVSKREIVKDPARDERVGQSLEGETSNRKRLAFMAWLETELEKTQIEDL